MKRIVLAFMAASALTACAATPYQRQSTWSSLGYSERKLADDRFAVQFTGNAQVTRKAAEDLAVLRGAELCQAAGYTYLSVVSAAYTAQTSREYGMVITWPDAVAEVRCSHDAATGARAVADIIAQARAAYPQASPTR